MMPTKPGQRCRVIGCRSITNDEGKGPNYWRIVETVYLYSEKAGRPGEQVAVWQCKATDGLPLHTYYAAGPECAFLVTWLEVIPEEPLPPKTLETSKELDHA